MGSGGIEGDGQAIGREGRPVDDPGEPDPARLSRERLGEMRTELFRHFGKITRWKVLCRERDALNDEEKIRLAEEVLRTPTTGTVADWRGSHRRLSGDKSPEVDG